MTRDELVAELARCRDLFPIPERGTELERLWSAAVYDPMCVAVYVRAQIEQVTSSLDLFIAMFSDV